MVKPLAAREQTTHYCDRCADDMPVSEWQYEAKAYSGQGGWRHIAAACNWLQRVPKAV